MSRHTDHNENSAGFSLIEMLFAIAMGLTVTAIMTVFVFNGLKLLRISTGVQDLHSDGLFLTNRLDLLIKQSADAQISDPSTMVLVGTDQSTQTVAKFGTNIMINGSNLNSLRTQVNNLTFTKFPRSVKVSFTLFSIPANKSLTVNTTFALRNSTN